MDRLLFSKDERLCSKKTVDQLFITGYKLSSGVFTMVFAENKLGDQPPMRILFAISKKNIPGAVQRNLVRRRMREAFRKNKHGLYDYLNDKSLSLNAVLVYRDRKVLSYGEIESSLTRIFGKLIHHHEKAT